MEIHVLALVASTGAGASISEFRTPSGNIGCVYSSSPANLRCDIRSGLVPKPPQPQTCDLDFGDSVTINKTGLPRYVCHGDTAIDPQAGVLAYGRTWSRDGFTCTSQTSGLRCANQSRHGFFLSRQHSYRF